MEKRKYEGLDVPVEPKLDWYWLSDTSAGCEISKGGDLEDCAYTYCHKCIYSRYNAAKRNAFYKEFIDNTPAIGQKESLDKTCARLVIKTIPIDCYLLVSQLLGNILPNRGVLPTVWLFL